MDESCKQLIGEVRESIPCAPGKSNVTDARPIREGEERNL